MTELVYFLGRFHVLLLHLPIGILLLAVVLEGLSRRERFIYLAPAVDVVWLAGALTGIGTVVLGYMHASEGGFAGSALNGHRIAGTSLAILACVTWVLRSRLAGVYAKVWPVCSALTVVLLFVTGHFGGNLTHGHTYLVQYAPETLRRLTGTVARAKPRDLASADVYLDVVAPSLQQRCGSCHNNDKHKGGLAVTSHADLMKGGENGPVIVAGDPDRSDLFRRIALPEDHEDFMPKDGKTPLTAQQTAAIRWWISIGAPATAAIASLTPSAEDRAALESVLGFGSGTTPTAGQQVAINATPPAVNVPPPDAKVVETLESNGFVVRPIANDSPLVQVDFTATRALTDADFTELTKIGPQIYALNLRAAGVVDSQLATIGKFENLAHLRLELNPISDAGLAALADLKNLDYLNLYGTKITDKGAETLSRMEKLQTLFVWKTRVTDKGVAAIKSARADVQVDGGFDPRNFPVGPKVIPVVN